MKQLFFCLSLLSLSLMYADSMPQQPKPPKDDDVADIENYDENGYQRDRGRGPIRE
jgi:hypothetical protein